MPGYLARFVDSLAERVELLRCFQYTPLTHERERCDTALDSTAVELVSIGPHFALGRRLFRRNAELAAVEPYLPNLDAMLIRGPSPLLPGLGDLAMGLDLPVALLLVGDYVRSVSGLHQPWWKKQIAALLARQNRRGQDRVAKRSLVFVNNAELLEDYDGKAARVVYSRTSTLRSTDMYERDDTCKAMPITLLYAGRLERAKGLFELVEALALLSEEGLDCRLDLVGWEEPGEEILDEIERRAEELRVRHCVRYLGFKTVGDELLACYRAADIFVIASNTAEGFPRTIWEAMASSTPVVATAIGSLPDVLQDGRDAVLVPGGNAVALAQGIRRVVEDGRLRKTLIRNGMCLATENTVEGGASSMIEVLADWVACHDRGAP
jgi:glycosyltransferase involved in cell wall biosynthesis